MYEMLEFTEEKRTLQTCAAEGGTGGPEKTHLWVKGSHSVFHSQRAIGFSSAAHESTELSICFLWRRWGCAQSLSMTYRVHGECSCALLTEHRGKGSSTGPPLLLSRGYPVMQPWFCLHLPIRAPTALGHPRWFSYQNVHSTASTWMFSASSATGEN